jgi:hypothetical protein
MNRSFAGQKKEFICFLFRSEGDSVCQRFLYGVAIAV